MNNPTYYQNTLSGYFNSAPTVFDLITNSVENPSVWFKQQLNIIHYIDFSIENSIFDFYKQKYPHHILPLLSLSKESIYLIATPASVTYGLYDTYVTVGAADQQEEESKLVDKVLEIGKAQSYHMAIWNELTNQNVPTRPTVVKDSLRIKHDLENPYIVESAYSARNSWATPYQTEGLNKIYYTTKYVCSISNGWSNC